jgi:hypothetical protein
MSGAVAGSDDGGPMRNSASRRYLSLVAAACLVLSCLSNVHIAKATDDYVFGVLPTTPYDVRQDGTPIQSGLTSTAVGALKYSVTSSGTISVTQSTGEGDTVAPSAVTDLAADGTTQTGLTLSWTAPGDDGSSGTATSYDVRYSTSPITSSNWANATPISGVPAPHASGTAESFTVTGLTGGVTYYFALKAGDEVPNWSSLSNVASGTTLIPPDTTPPAAITNLAAGSATQTSVALTWTATGDDGASGTATGYDLRRSTEPITAGNWNGATPVPNLPAPRAAGTAESFTVTGLSAGTAYYFAIEAADEVPNWSGISNVVSATTQPSADTTPPARVIDLDATRDGPYAMTVSWTATGDDGASGTASRYDLRYSLSLITDANWSLATVVPDLPAPHAPGTRESAEVGSLSPHTYYYFALKVGDEVPNWSALSDVVRARTQGGRDSAAPFLVTDLTVTDSTETSLTLTWATPADSISPDADGSVNIANWDMRISTAPIDITNFAKDRQVSIPAPSDPGTKVTTTINGLSPGTIYHVAIRSEDGAGNWSGLADLVAKTPMPAIPPADGSPPLPPSSLDGRWNGIAVLLNWSASPSPDVVSYRIERRTSDQGASQVVADMVTATSWKDASAAAGLNYVYVVSAYDREGNLSVASPEVTVSTIITGPTRGWVYVDQLGIEPQRDGQPVRLRWSAKLAAGSPALDGFRVYRERLDSESEFSAIVARRQSAAASAADSTPAGQSGFVLLTPGVIPDSLRGEGAHNFTDGAQLVPGIYAYWIEAVPMEGTSVWFDPQRVNVFEGMGRIRVWPNPTQGPLSISYSLASEGPVEGAIFDLKGRRVGEFHEQRPAGEGVWRISDLRGRFSRDLPGGVYFIRMSLAGQLATARIVLR